MATALFTSNKPRHHRRPRPGQPPSPPATAASTTSTVRFFDHHDQDTDAAVGGGSTLRRSGSVFVGVGLGMRKPAGDYFQQHFSGSARDTLRRSMAAFYDQQQQGAGAPAGHQPRPQQDQTGPAAAETRKQRREKAAPKPVGQVAGEAVQGA